MGMLRIGSGLPASPTSPLRVLHNEPMLLDGRMPGAASAPPVDMRLLIPVLSCLLLWLLTAPAPAPGAPPAVALWPI